jgi:sulfide:quinone oxidoreductase
VLIAGGGVAALETMLALRDLAEERVDIELVAPESYFWYRPLAVAEPFQHSEGEHFDLATLADEAGAGLKLDALTSVDTHQRVARTAAGAELPYDVLVLAMGTRSEIGIEGAFTPVYELALQTATHLAGRADVAAQLTIVTPEERPLGLFGRAASAEVARLLASREIALQCGCHPVAADAGALRLVPRGTHPV